MPSKDKDMTTPSKERALELMQEVESSKLERDLQEDKPEARGWTQRAVTKILKSISDADADAALLRIAKLSEANPEASPDDLAEMIIKKKAQQTAAIGAASSSASLIPIVGTLSAMTVGVAADITATFKLQAEMVLELAAAYEFPLDELDEQKVIFLVTGVSTGSNVLLNRAGHTLTAKLSEQYAQKWLSAALPFIGVAASSSTNALSTYVIGQRAQSYFRDGPEAVSDWKGSLRALVGVDELKLGGWLSEGSANAWDAVSGGAQKTGEAIAGAATATGGAVATGATKTGEVIATGATKTAQGVGAAARAVGAGMGTAAQGVAETGANLADRVGDVLNLPWHKKDKAEADEGDESSDKRG